MTPGIRKTMAGVTIGTGNKPVIFKTGDVTGTGTNQATAAPLLNVMNNVAGADGTVAVKLPVITAPGMVCFVYNSVATSGLKVFPNTGAAINGGTGDASVTIEGKTFAQFVATTTLNWAAIYTADS